MNLMSFGLVNSRATYNRMMRMLLRGQINVDHYVDDVMGHSETRTDHLVTLQELFGKIRDAGLTIRPIKCLLDTVRYHFWVIL